MFSLADRDNVTTHSGFPPAVLEDTQLCVDSLVISRTAGAVAERAEFLQPFSNAAALAKTAWTPETLYWCQHIPLQEIIYCRSPALRVF